MKKILLTLLLMCGLIVPRAQIRDTTQPKVPLQFDPDLLFQKSGKQKTISWTLALAGAGLTIAGNIADANAIENKPADPFGNFPSTIQTLAVMLLPGAAMMIAGIPFFILSRRNGRDNPWFKNESGPPFRHLHNNEIFFSFRVNITL